MKSGRLFCINKGIIWIALTVILSVIQVEASVGEQIEENSIPLFDGFAKMDYCMFLETHLDYGVTLDYYRYGIYGDFVSTTQEGETVYLALNEKLLGNTPILCTHREWFDNEEPLVWNISPDLEWVISRQNNYMNVIYTDRIYYQGTELGQKKGYEGDDIALFAMQRKEDGEIYEQMEEEKIEKWEKIIRKAREWSADAFWESWAQIASAIDEYGNLLAVAAPDNKSIGIYSVDNGEELQHIEMAACIDTDWPIEVSQIKGNEEIGWIVFSSGDTTYLMSYPDGELKKLGEFMYGTTFSPDGKYLAYCTGNEVLFDLCHDWASKDTLDKMDKWNQMYERWESVGTGWYVEELETGKKTFIYIEPWQEDYGSIIRSGRCVWIKRDKLLQVFEQS
ncbi:MAG: hypothetical protein NC313_03565 [Butyrivibrio sp.]|nr:hypothetical protein [Butyrivibrio sp.]